MERVQVSLTEILEEVADRGYWVNNLYQHDDTTWCCSLRKLTTRGTFYYNYALGETPGEAVALALQKSADEQGEPPLRKDWENQHWARRGVTGRVKTKDQKPCMPELNLKELGLSD